MGQRTKISESRKKISISDNWWGNTKDNVISIPLTKESPEWKSSTPTPADQLIDLGQKGPFVNSFRDYNKDENLVKTQEGDVKNITSKPPVKKLVKVTEKKTAAS